MTKIKHTKIVYCSSTDRHIDDKLNETLEWLSNQGYKILSVHMDTGSMSKGYVVYQETNLEFWFNFMQNIIKIIVPLILSLSITILTAYLISII